MKNLRQRMSEDMKLRGFTRLHQQDLIAPIRPLLTDETQFVWLLKFQRTCPRFSPIEHLCRLRDTKTLNSLSNWIKNSSGPAKNGTEPFLSIV